MYLKGGFHLHLLVFPREKVQMKPPTVVKGRVHLRQNCYIFEIRLYKNQLLNGFYFYTFLNPYSIEEVKPYVRSDVDRAWESAVSGPWVKYFSGAPNWSRKKNFQLKIPSARNENCGNFHEFIQRQRLEMKPCACAQYLPLLWPVRQSGAAVEHNDVILTNLMTSLCFNPIPIPIPIPILDSKLKIREGLTAII